MQPNPATFRHAMALQRQAAAAAVATEAARRSRLRENAAAAALTHCTLREYLADCGRKDALAIALDTNPTYLWQVANNWRGRKAGPAFAMRIERATGGAVPRWITRPDLWQAPEPLRSVQVPACVTPARIVADSIEAAEVEALFADAKREART